MRLTAEEREELAERLAGDSLGAMLGRWERFVSVVERGYDDSIYEYTNDLSVRDRLARVADGASPGLQEKLSAELAATDGRFEEATEEAGKPLGSGGWWWRRVPRRQVGELADDLSALGHLT